jgi:hypothetical protein
MYNHITGVFFLQELEEKDEWSLLTFGKYLLSLAVQRVPVSTAQSPWNSPPHYFPLQLLLLIPAPQS